MCVCVCVQFIIIFNLALSVVCVCVCSLLLLLLLFNSFTHDIYNYIRETNHVARVYNVATILWLHYAAHVKLFTILNDLYF